jgi:hypothetical protein
MWTMLKNQWNAVSGNAKWDAIKWSGAVVIATAGYLLHKIHHLPDWAIATGIFIVALIVFTLSLNTTTFRTTKQPSQPSTSQIVVQGVGLEKTIEAIEGYYKKNDGPMMQEIEAHFLRLAAHFTDFKEREQFLIHAVSNGAIAMFHEVTWSSIFRSQIDLLQELNTHAMTLEQVKPYYDAGAANNLKFYAKYSFEQWLAYLRGQSVILQDGNVVQITVRGKDFLRHLVLEGRSAKDRAA